MLCAVYVPTTAATVLAYDFVNAFVVASDHAVDLSPVTMQAGCTCILLQHRRPAAVAGTLLRMLMLAVLLNLERMPTLHAECLRRAAYYGTTGGLC